MLEHRNGHDPSKENDKIPLLKAHDLRLTPTEIFHGNRQEYQKLFEHMDDFTYGKLGERFASEDFLRRPLSDLVQAMRDVENMDKQPKVVFVPSDNGHAGQ